MIKDFALLYLIVLGQLFSVAIYAEEIRDYYSEPGLNPFKGDAGNTANESIDPFSGALQIVHQDLKVPGNGGLDINVNRVYNHFSGGGTPAPNPMGMGWSMHFGRIVFPDVDKVCSQNLWSVSTIDNPSLEFSDGRRELLVLSSIGGYLVSKSSWRMDCTGGYPRVYSPEGTVYIMDELSGSANSYYVSSITDVHGNYLSISYYVGDSSNNFLVPSSVASNDGRLVSFSYTGGMLSSINSNGQIWTYSYAPVIGISGIQKLVSATRPDGLMWEYQYFPVTGGWLEPSASMSFIKYPRGATVTYNYQAVAFYSGDDPRWAIESKVANDGINAYSWDYVFQPGSEIINTREFDLTIIQTPYGTEEYRHYGTQYAIGYIDALWRVGLLAEKKISNGGVVKRKEIYNWGKREISDENYWHGKDLGAIDEYVYAPILLAKGVEVDGFGTATYFSGYDSFGNPAKIDYKSNAGTIPDRVISYTYSNNTNSWILGKVLTEVTREGDGGAAIRSINNTYNANGDLTLSDTNGVVYEYSYTGEGDLNTVLDPNNKTITYGEYFRGLPQLEVYPEGVSLARTVNDTGTVASQTDGNGSSTSFSYDDLNRLTAINYPIGTNVAIAYSANGQSLTRGIYSESISYDGFGNQTNTSRSSINISKTYDAHGRVLTETLPGYSSKITYEYDILGRVTLKKNPDNTSLTYVYTEPYTTITDENGHETTIQYLYWGDHNNGRDAIAITTELNQTLQYRNVLGQLDYVWQGETGGLGFTRSFTYDSRGYLASEDHPDLVGNILYTRDDMGNVLSKKVEGEPALSYSYDDLGRLLNVDYPAPSSDVSYQYDNNSNILVIGNANSIRTSNYDQLNQLVQETVDIGGTSYTTSYDYNGLGYLSRVTYPSSRTVDYFPDELGRPTKALPYVDVAAYYPSGNLQQLQFSNGVLETFSEDIRLFLSNSTLAASGFLGTSTYYHDGKGNLTAFNTVSDNIALESRSFSYDALGRLILEGDSLAWTSRSINYDYMGNIKEKEDNIYSYLGVMLTKVITPSFLERWISHDSYGNVSNNDLVEIDIITGLPEVVRESRQYVYDHAGNMTHASYSHFDGNVTSFGPDFVALYDGLNNRVNKIRNGESTDFLYAANGILTGEYQNGELAFGKENFYLGGKLIASVKANKAPIATAGLDQQVPGGSIVYLDGLAADDGEITSYQWQQTAGLAVSLSGSGKAVSFIAPNGVEVLEFLLEATDEHGDVGGDTVTITTVPNETPVAAIGSIQTVIEGVSFVLNGSESTDDGGIVSYLWQRTTSPANASVNIDNPSSAIINVTIATGAPSNFTETFSLTVADNAGLEDSASVTVQVISLLSDNDADQLKDYWEITYFGDTQSYTGADDPDADGFSNLEEFINDTDPTIPEPPPSQPTNIQMVVGQNSVTVSWDPQITAASYRVYWSTDPSMSIMDTVIINLEDPLFYQEPLNAQENYYIQITALNSQGESMASDVSVVSPRELEWDVNFPEVDVGIDTITAQQLMGVDGSEYYLWVISSRKLYFKFRDASGNWGNTELIRNTFSEPVYTSIDIHFFIDDNERGDRVISWAENGIIKYRLWDNVQKNWSDVLEVNGPPVYTRLQIESIYLDNQGQILALVTDPNQEDSNNGHLYSIRYHPARGWEPPISLGDMFGVPVPNHPGVKAKFANDGSFGVIVWEDSLDFYTAVYKEDSGWGNFAKLTESVEGRPDTQWNTIDIQLTPLSTKKAAIHWTVENFTNQGSKYYGYVSTFDEVAQSWGSPFLIFGPGHTSGKLTSNEYGQMVATAILSDSAYGRLKTPGQPWSNPIKLYTANGKPTIRFLEASISPEGTGILVINSAAGWALSDARETVMQKFSTEEGWLEQTPFLDGGAPKTRNTMIVGRNGQVALAWRDIASGITKIARYQVAELLSAPPKANSGFDQIVSAGQLVFLDGSASYDIDGTIANYAWSQIAGTPVSLQNINSITATFDSSGLSPSENLSFKLSVTDDLGLIDIDTTTINVAQGNTPPIADAGPDQIIDPGIIATLDGSTSSDPGGTIVSYQWTQLTGTAVTLVDASTATASFDTGGLGAGEVLTFELSVTDDGGLVSTDTTTVTMTSPNQPPVADAGPDATINLGATAVLDGSNSSDSDGTIVTYQWQQLSGTSVALQNATSAAASFDTTGLVGGEVLTFELRVTDNNGAIASDQIALTIVSDAIAPVTTLQSTRYKSKGKTYFDLTLTPNESATSYFRVTGEGNVTAGGSDSTDWQTYTVPVTVKLAGNSAIATFEYYSEDTAGNTEVTQQEILQ